MRVEKRAGGGWVGGGGGSGIGVLVVLTAAAELGHGVGHDGG